MRILLTAFDGEENASKVMLDKLFVEEEHQKVYLPKQFNQCVSVLQKELEEKTYDLIVSFEEKALVQDKIYIEIIARKDGNWYQTDFEYDSLCNILREKGYSVTISINAGNSYCNEVYYSGLEFLHKHNLGGNMIFLHIPTLSHISNLDNFCQLLSQYLSDCKIVCN